MLAYSVHLLQTLLNIQAFNITSTNNIYIWFLLLYYKMTKLGTYSKKPNVIYFCFAEYAIYTESTQAINWWQKFLWCYLLPRCHPEITYAEIFQIVWIPSPLYTLWKKSGVTKTIDFAFSQTSPPSSSYLHT